MLATWKNYWINQLDQDFLPDYEILDPILEKYIELDQHPEKIISDGYNPETVYKITKLVDKNEYKRRQSAPGIRITNRAFGKDRRYPISSGYTEEKWIIWFLNLQSHKFLGD